MHLKISVVKQNSIMALHHVFLLVYVLSAFLLFAQVNSQDPCPSKHRCREISTCRPNLMKLISGRPIACGLTQSRRVKICCPDPSQEPENITPVPFIAGGGNLPLNSNPGNCGKSLGPASQEGYVIGGRDAEQGTWPWMVAIMMSDDRGIQSPQCTGYLIDKKHVLSAAHCFKSNQTSLYSTRIGNVDLTEGDVYHIQSIAIHKRYRKGQFYNDIALITLSQDVDIPDFVPVCLPSSRSATNLTGKGTTVVGWGATTPGGPMSLTLKELSAMPVVSNERCDEIYRNTLTSFRRQFPRGISSLMICAGFLDEDDKDGCGGDSGGPLMMQEDNKWYAVGIVSFGYRCGRKGFPGGYTKVSEFIDWINSNKISS